MTSRERNLNKVLRYIQKNAPVEYSSLKKNLNVSDPTLSNYLKILERRDDIEHFEKLDDRRKKWYKIKSEKKVNLEIKKHEIKNVIGSMAHQITSVQEITEHGSKITFDVFVKLAESIKEKAKKYGKTEEDICAALELNYSYVMDYLFKDLAKREAKAFKKYDMPKGHEMLFVIKIEML